MIDQGLKERLTGAVVLVIAGVILIPLFLDGPARPGPDQERRALPVPDRTVAQRVTQPGRADAPGGQPAGEARSVESARRDVSAEVADPQPEPQNQPVTVVPPDPLSAWAVQVGSFSSQDNAERLRDELKGKGYRAFVTRLSDGDRVLYRVRIGPEQDRARAEVLARRLKKDGQATAIVRHP